jgi:hypothetical protein
VQRGKLEGQFHDGVDPVHLLADVMGLCFNTFSNTYTTSATLEIDLRAPAVLRDRLDSIRQLVRRGISRAPGANVDPLKASYLAAGATAGTGMPRSAGRRV